MERQANNAPKRIIGTALDITESKNTEVLLTRERANAELANKAKSDFLAGMSHEFRTPLNAIIGFSEIMDSGVLGPIHNDKYREYVKDIFVSGRHLLCLINNMLDVSKIEADMMELIEAPVDIENVAIDSIKLVEQRAIEGNVTVSVNLPAALPRLLGDETRIRQIMLNLLSNGVKFTPSGGRVTVTGEIDNLGAIIVTVTDTGIGMTPEELEDIFEPFRQGKNIMTQPHDGTGLGLHLVKSLTTLHEGTVAIESELEEGTAVSVRFPPERTIPPPI